MSLVLALDFSQHSTGWAIGKPGRMPEISGTITPIESKEPIMWISATEQIEQLCTRYGARKVIFAEFHHSPNPLAARLNFGLRAVVMADLHRLGIPCRPVSEISSRKVLGINISMKPTPAEQEDFDRRKGKYEGRVKKAKNPPRFKRDMKARVLAWFKEKGLPELDTHDERDASVLLMAHGIAKELA